MTEYYTIKFSFNKITVGKLDWTTIPTVKVDFDGSVYTPQEVLRAINYGEPLLYPHLVNPRHKFDSDLFLIWDSSLIFDLAICLFGKKDAEEVMLRLSMISKQLELCETARFDSETQVPSVPERGTPRERLQEDWAIAEDMYTLLGAIGRRRPKDYRMYPHSYGINRLIKFVKYLREGVNKEMVEPSGRLNEFFEKNPSSWDGELRNCIHFHYANCVIVGYSLAARVMQLSWDYEFLAQLSSIFLGSGTFLDDPKSIATYPDRNIEPKEYVEDWLNMKPSHAGYWRWQFLSFLGITDLDAEGGKIFDSSEGYKPLETLAAANLLGGPFRIGFTERAAEHLTFSGSHKQPILKLLSFKKVKMLYIPQRVGIATYIRPCQS